MPIPKHENIFFFLKRAKRIQALWRGYKFRKEIQYHMVCGACDNSEIIIGNCKKKEYLTDVSKIWNHRCKNCLSSYVEKTTRIVLCVQHLGFASCFFCRKEPRNGIYHFQQCPAAMSTLKTT